jgi:hypothetical protein
MNTIVTGLMLACAVLVPAVSHAERILPPAVPAEIQVDPGFVPYLMLHAIGTQGYACVAVGSTYSWKPFGPRATLFDEYGQQMATHFLGTTPYSLLPNPTWQHSRDSSIVWAAPIKTSTDPGYVAPSAIPWVLLEAAVVGDGPTGGVKLTQTRFIQRVNTFEGKAPTTGCAVPDNIGARALVYYEADYIFYREKVQRVLDGEE